MFHFSFRFLCKNKLNTCGKDGLGQRVKIELGFDLGGFLSFKRVGCAVLFRDGQDTVFICVQELILELPIIEMQDVM